MKIQKDRHKCALFKCQRRMGSYCCHYCAIKKGCAGPCVNHPDRCGKYVLDMC